MHVVMLALCLSLGSSATLASERTVQTRSVDGSFEEVFDSLRDAVINEGFVVDYVGHVDKMLERTAGAASKNSSPYLHALSIQFCSSSLTHEAVSVDAGNLGICPLVAFVFETRANPGKITVGYQVPELTVSKGSDAVAIKTNTLLSKVIEAATSGT